MDLQAYGFVASGRWVTSARTKSGITFKLDVQEQDRVVYAFVVDDEPKYIGICEKSTTTLKVRMERYKYLKGAGTNERIATAILQCLTEGKTVQIFALKPKAKYRHVDLNIDLVKGLENPLIERFRAEWNAKMRFI